jgi:hypothetical protein
LYGVLLIFPQVVTPLYRFIEGWIGYLAILPTLILMPLLASLGPFYVLITKGIWLPIVAVYGGWVPFSVFTWIADKLDDSQ